VRSDVAERAARRCGPACCASAHATFMGAPSRRRAFQNSWELEVPTFPFTTIADHSVSLRQYMILWEDRCGPAVTRRCGKEHELHRKCQTTHISIRFAVRVAVTR
jgi:hypothetical protein